MSTEKMTFHVETAHLQSPFKTFLDNDKNKRIFFTGRYGAGKTTFLRQFFKEYENEFDFYHLSPVRYHIHGNDDVIDMLKYDIFLELIKNHSDLLKEKKVEDVPDFIELAAAFYAETGGLKSLLKNIVSFGAETLKLVPDPNIQVLSKLGRPMRELLDFDHSWQDFMKNYIAGEKGLVDKITANIRSKDILEPDLLSSLLHEKIQVAKGNKKSVLLLDDLDRIDPEHIFRILNIFSVHFGNDDQETNKFGFDHIIIVADNKNIKNIFEHKYGAKTNYDGYIQKFYSTELYQFNINILVQEKISSIIHAFSCENEEFKKSLSRDGLTSFVIQVVLFNAIAADKVSLRQLIKPINSKLNILNNAEPEYYLSDSWELYLDLSIKILIAVFSGKDELVNLLSDIATMDNGNSPYIDRVGSRFSALMFRRLKPDLKSGDIEHIKYSNQEIGLKFEITERGPSLGTESGNQIDLKTFLKILSLYIESGKYNKKHRTEYEWFD